MLEILKDNPIFNNVSFESLKPFLKSSGEIKYFLKDDVAYDKAGQVKSIMFLIKGSARVEQVSEENLTFLKRIVPGELFGVLSIFTDVEYYPTRITFEKKSRVLILDEETVLKLLHINPLLLKNYLTFFNGQVQYLLDRIALFSIPNGEDRVITYINRLKSKTTTNELILPMSKVELAEYLGIARSTLYRVFDKLVENQMLEINGNKLNILGGIK